MCYTALLYNFVWHKMNLMKILNAIAAWKLSKYGSQEPVDKLKFLNALISQIDEDKSIDELRKFAAAYLVKLMTDSACEKFNLNFETQLEKRIYLLMKTLDIDDIISVRPVWEPSALHQTANFI